MKAIEVELEIKSIRDIGTKKDGEIIEDRIVSLKSKDKVVALALKDNINNHPFKNLNKSTDIGLKVKLSLKLDSSSQTKLTDIT